MRALRLWRSLILYRRGCTSLVACCIVSAASTSRFLSFQLVGHRLNLIRKLKRRLFRWDTESPSRTGVAPETRTRQAGRARYPEKNNSGDQPIACTDRFSWKSGGRKERLAIRPEADAQSGR